MSGVIAMSNAEDVKEVANKLNEILLKTPNDFHYLKGYIERVAQENKEK